MIIRDYYVEKIKNYINKPLIKVITGMRRVGKSFIVRQIIEYLQEEGTEPGQILYINKESLDFDFIKTYRDLNFYVKEYFGNSTKQRYLFIDEIQEIELWEKTISSLFAENRYDITITGSNSRLLSSELSSLLSGRFVEINIYALSFKEFLKFRGEHSIDREQEFLHYLKFGGFPVIHQFDLNEELTYEYIQSLYNTILLKDVISRYNIRNVRLFQDLISFLFSNTGQIFSSNSISRYLKNQKKTVSVDTIQNYIAHLESSYMIHKVQRYDIRGKKLLELYEKYYFGDIALKNAVMGYKDEDISGQLENCVFLKLMQENYQVTIGKSDDLEVDFIAEKNGEKLYIQVAYLLESEESRHREFRAFDIIKDNYPKYVLSMDRLPPSNTEGIIRMNIAEFLLK